MIQLFKPIHSKIDSGHDYTNRYVLILGLLVFLLALLGIASRPIGSLASIWPANAFVLGAMLRQPLLRTPRAWLVACVSMVLADLVTSSPFLVATVLSVGNLVGVYAALYVLEQLPQKARQWDQRHGVLLLIFVALVASMSAGFVGMIAYPLLFDGTAVKGYIFWSVTEFVNFIAFLPVALSAPAFGQLWKQLKHPRRITLRSNQWMPAVLVFLLCAVTLFLEGPAKLILPIVALLWCAFSYSVFSTALLTLFFCFWTLVSLALGLDDAAGEASNWSTLMSWRVGISLIALVPIIVACYNSVRKEEMEALKWSALHDALTGALNRKGLEEYHQSLADSRSNYPLGLLMLDLDHFKSVNDQYGHSAGDHVLKSFVQTMQSHLRQMDVVARLGGEEFIVLLPQCSESAVAEVAERIKNSLSAEAIDLGDGHSISVTVSIGSAYSRSQEESLQNLLCNADQALYAAKDAGRNRVVSFEAINQ